MGIAFVIGHTPYSKGAFSKYFNSSEWDFYNKYFTKSMQSVMYLYMITI